MRYNEFKLTEQQLSELKMSPGRIAKEIKGVNAIAGVEFEMYVPDISIENQKEDFSNDRVPTSYDDIVEFFHITDKSVLNELEDDIIDFYFSKADDIYDNGKAPLKKIKNEILDYINSEYPGISDQEQHQKLKMALGDDDDEDGRSAFQLYYSKNIGKFSDWAKRYKIKKMSDLIKPYGLEWPEQVSGIESLAREFKNVVKSPVISSLKYHGVTRDNVSYIVEPDGSLTKAKSGDDSGIEFVSPPLPLNDMIQDITNVMKWANSKKCYTNQSCGLHMNISIKGVDHSKLDNIKLALFVGENYVLKQFERVGNDFCKSVINKISKQAENNPTQLPAIFRTMKNQLHKAASGIIKSSMIDHYNGLNVKSNYVEFRYAGNDWLNYDFDKLVNVLNRYVYAYSIACDPEAHKQEYAKKLYKLLSQSDNQQNSLKYFSEYSAGILDKSDLKTTVKSIQHGRAVSRGKVKPSMPQFKPSKNKSYSISLKPERSSLFPGFGHQAINVSAETEGAAIWKAINMVDHSGLDNNDYFDITMNPEQWFDVVEH